jgi:hypothetical protein
VKGMMIERPIAGPVVDDAEVELDSLIVANDNGRGMDPTAVVVRQTDRPQCVGATRRCRHHASR